MQDILNILKTNKYENDFAGPMPYDKEEYAKMIVDYLDDKKGNRSGVKSN